MLTGIINNGIYSVNILSCTKCFRQVVL